MAEQILSKRTALPTTLVADTVYFIKGTSDTKTKIYVTTTTTPVTAIPIAYVTDDELTTLLLGKENTITAGVAGQYWDGTKTWQALNKAAVGLGNVLNLAPADLPVSTATQTALDLKIPLSQKGAVNGVATLDSGGKVPSAQLPSYVDDVLEYANLAAFPATGESGKMYMAIDTNAVYRWSGSAYIKISSGDVSEMANFFVRYDTSQSLTAGQKTTARTNIGALGTADLASYVLNTRTISTSTGLLGGGDLSANRTLSFDTTWGDARYALKADTYTKTEVTNLINAKNQWGATEW